MYDSKNMFTCYEPKTALKIVYFFKKMFTMYFLECVCVSVYIM